MKNADVLLVPHPFAGNDLSGLTVVLLDPASQFVEQLRALNREGESVSRLLHNESIVVDNVPLARRMPPGVMAVAGKWRAR
jgi:hypothetical protein